MVVLNVAEQTLVFSIVVRPYRILEISALEASAFKGMSTRTYQGQRKQ